MNKENNNGNMDSAQVQTIPFSINNNLSSAFFLRLLSRSYVSTKEWIRKLFIPKKKYGNGKNEKQKSFQFGDKRFTHATFV